MNKDYLPFYNSLNDKDKAFWMECTKEELIKLIETLEIAEVKSLKFVYYKEKNYGGYDNRNLTTITINDKGE